MSTALEKLVMLMDEHTSRAVRLGYALGYSHGERYLESEVPEDGPEFRVLKELELMP